MDDYTRAIIGEEGYCIGPNPECGCADCDESWAEHEEDE